MDIRACTCSHQQRATVNQFGLCSSKLQACFDLLCRLSCEVSESKHILLCCAGKVLSKCGRCSRYMRLIAARPSRLYCPTCEEVFNVPQARPNPAHFALTFSCLVRSRLILRRLLSIVWNDSNPAKQHVPYVSRVKELPARMVGWSSN